MMRKSLSALLLAACFGLAPAAWAQDGQAAQEAAAAAAVVESEAAVVEEAVAAGITDMIFITGRSKRAIEDHFDKAVELEAELAAKNKQALLHPWLQAAFHSTKKRPISHTVVQRIHHQHALDPRGANDFANLLGDLLPRLDDDLPSSLSARRVDHIIGCNPAIDLREAAAVRNLLRLGGVESLQNLRVGAQLGAHRSQ